MKQLALAFGILSLVGACAQQENNVHPAERRYEDTLSLASILAAPDAPAARTDFDNWLRLYPEAAIQMNVREGTTALGQVAAAYFAAAPEARASFIPYMDTLLSLGADPNVLLPWNGQRRGLLHLAAELGDETLIQSIIRQNGTAAPIPQFTCDAAPQLRPQAKRVGLDINFREDDPTLARSALHYAVLAQQTAMVEELLSLGANPQLTDTAGVAPLQLAASQGPMLAQLELYAGTQLRFDSELRAYVDELLTIADKTDNRLTVGSIDTRFATWADAPEFAATADFNQAIVSCSSGQTLNLLGTAALSSLAEPIRAPLLWNRRNTTIQSWIDTRGARVCDPLQVKAEDGTLAPTNAKTLVGEALKKQNQSASTALKTANKKLWCDTIRPAAQAESCWDDDTDAAVDASLTCS